jgi:hypothetical protein
MKKNTMKDQEPNRKPHRLSLKRETIQVLGPVLLELARGGLQLSTMETGCGPATSATAGSC